MASTASSNPTPCLAMLLAALASSHSKSPCTTVGTKANVSRSRRIGKTAVRHPAQRRRRLRRRRLAQRPPLGHHRARRQPGRRHPARRRVRRDRHRRLVRPHAGRRRSRPPRRLPRLDAAPRRLARPRLGLARSRRRRRGPGLHAHHQRPGRPRWANRHHRVPRRGRRRAHLPLALVAPGLAAVLVGHKLLLIA